MFYIHIDPVPKVLIASVAPQFYCNTEGLDVNNILDQLKCPFISVPVGETTQLYFTYDYITISMEGSQSDYWIEIGWLILTLVVLRIINLIALKYVSLLKR